ncbi:hypothetical protein FNN75_05370 [Salmonella enterica subsp. arizonae]|nr:hypothetical protein [Salmonella enterica subsp. arizonae]SUF61807.1 Uncharacterised protein [Salmonella enterica]
MVGVITRVQRYSFHAMLIISKIKIGKMYKIISVDNLAKKSVSYLAIIEHHYALFFTVRGTAKKRTKSLTLPNKPLFREGLALLFVKTKS